MKMRLMTFDEACKAVKEAYPMSANLINKSLLGITKKAIPWGKKVEVDINTLRNGYIPTYDLNGFFVPTCVFKVNDANTNDVLRYGIILTDDELWDKTKTCVRIKIVSYEQAVYYVKMINGNVVEFKKVGAVG